MRPARVPDPDPATTRKFFGACGQRRAEAGGGVRDTVHGSVPLPQVAAPAPLYPYYLDSWEMP